MSTGNRHASMFDRLVAHIVIDEYSGCWNWTGTTRKHSGGVLRPALSMRVPGKAHPILRNAARMMCECIHGPMDPTDDASHLCEDNTLCICPDHVLPETKAQNMARRGEKQREVVRLHPDNDPDWRDGVPADPSIIPF